MAEKISELESLIGFILEKIGVEANDEKIQTISAEAIRHYRGGSIDIPNYKTTLRNQDLLNEYHRRINEGHSHERVIRELARKYLLTPKYTAALIRTV